MGSAEALHKKFDKGRGDISEPGAVATGSFKAWGHSPKTPVRCLGVDPVATETV
jgi:hypothetical protein